MRLAEVCGEVSESEVGGGSKCLKKNEEDLQ